MEKHGYLPKAEKSAIPFEKQDSLTRLNFVFTKLDSVIGNDNILVLKNDWPYVKTGGIKSKYQPEDLVNLFKPADFIDSIAMYRIEGKISWTDAHLMAASNYLRRDDIQNYLKHFNILIYQYPVLKNYNTALKYFYERNKINLDDFTAKRAGLLALYNENTDDAIALLRNAYKQSPNDPLILYSLSLAFTKKKEYKISLDLIDTCLKINQNYPEAKALRKQILSHL
jgi:tetratricopeptide (TPR) repeat protein